MNDVTNTNVKTTSKEIEPCLKGGRCEYYYICQRNNLACNMFVQYINSFEVKEFTRYNSSIEHPYGRLKDNRVPTNEIYERIYGEEAKRGVVKWTQR